LAVDPKGSRKGWQLPTVAEKTMRTIGKLLSILCNCLFLQSFTYATEPATEQEFCVDSAQELIETLHLYESMPDRYMMIIKVVQGTYNVGTQLGFLINEDRNSVAVKLLGGYTSGCSERTIDPRNTVIDAGDRAGSVFGLRGEGSGDFLIEGLTFSRFRAPTDFPTFELSLELVSNADAIYTIRHSRFVHNSGGVIVLLQSGNMKFVNNLVSNNTASFDAVAVDDHREDSQISFTNNTVANNTGDGFATAFFYGSDRLSEIANNIFWGNSGIDLVMNDFLLQVPTIVSHNIYGTVNSTIPLPADNLIADPQFIHPLSMDYRLGVLSPAINSGTAFQFSATPGRDLFGSPRVVGSRIDRGAIESTQNDLTSYTVTTTSDNGSNVAPLAGSLRAAIKAANAATVPFEVRFQISGACPRILNVVGNMLDITGDVTINGTTQAGWIENVQYTRFDGTLCLLLNGSDGASSTPWAFHVPSSASNARLAVRGLMFAGFSDAAIKLEGGDNHLISGNQFGGIGFTVPNNNAVRVTGNAGNTMIGGFDWAGAINLIAGSDGPGVVLDNAAGGSVLGNNLIGFQTDGVTAAPNQNGVYVFNSPSNSIMYNSIGNSDSAGILISGSGATGNVVQNNVIGMSLESGYPSAVNHGAGVLMMFGARNTTVGASLNGSGGGNLITLNGGPGVWVSTSGGTGNRILGNTSYANQGLAIDLGVAGGTENQANPGVGPNALQNYPLAMSAISVPAGLSITGVLNSTPNTLFRIDAYRSNGCGPDARAESNAVLGHFQVTTNAQGLAEFNDTLPLSGALSGQFMGLTATDSAGNTSEIGNCELIRSSTPVFKSGFEACENGDPDPGCAP
jgi:hypothetical protein